MSPRFIPKGMKHMHGNRALRKKEKEKMDMDMEEHNKAQESAEAPRYANQIADRLIRAATDEDQKRVSEIGAGVLTFISAEIAKAWPDTDETRMEPHMVAPAILGNAVLQLCLMPENRATPDKPLALGSSVSVQVIVEMLIRSGLIQFSVPDNNGLMELDIETVPAGAAGESNDGDERDGRGGDGAEATDEDGAGAADGAAGVVAPKLQ